MIEKTLIHHGRSSEYCLVGLCGRGMGVGSMASLFEEIECPYSYLSIQPKNYRWYEQPFSPEDQDAALESQKENILILNEYLDKNLKFLGFDTEKVIIFGFSAGGVMAIQHLATANKKYAGVACLSGAILSPNDLPEAKNDTRVLLKHSKDDDCFDWYERYLPMKNALLEKNYNLSVCELNYGGHSFTAKDVMICRQFIDDLK